MCVPSLVVMTLWYGIGLWQHAAGGDEISLTAPVFGSLLAVAGSSALVLLGGIRRGRPVTRYLDLVGLAGLAGMVGYFIVTRPGVMSASFEATVRNLTYDGLWLGTWLATLGLLLVALVVQRVPDSRLWTVPILGFGLLFWALPGLREGPWRVGTGDSGNRILAHILAVVVGFLVLAATEPVASRMANPTPADVARPRP
jgi:hypothetical protein